MTLKEHIDDIRDNLEQGLFTNEAAVSQGIVLRFLHALDWPIFNIQIVVPEYTVEKLRVDFALCPVSSKPLVFIEVKQVGKIEGAEEQLFGYAYREGIPIAILTDGQIWQFFYPIGQGDYRERKVYELNLIEGDSEENAVPFDKYLNYESVRTRKSIKIIENDYKQKKIENNLPEAWNKLVARGTTFGIDDMAETVENLCGYRPTDEQALDFLKSLKRGTGPVKRKSISPSISPVKPPPRKKGKQGARQTRLVVTMSNGEKVDHNIAATTFAEVIEKLGIERVRNRKYIERGTPLISTSEHPKYNQHKSERYYIFTNISTKEKKALLEKIATDLHEHLQVKIVDK